MDYAAKGQLIDWDDEEEKFFLCNKEENNENLSEEKLKQIFRESLSGLHYRE